MALEITDANFDELVLKSTKPVLVDSDLDTWNIDIKKISPKFVLAFINQWKNKGLLPIISSMPKDNHSVMQLYLDGFKNNFFTFFYVNENKSEKLNNSQTLSTKDYLKNKNLQDIIFAQKKATENIFNKKDIPFRSFEIKKRNEKTLGELFCFFILETILIGKSLNLNPYDQPAVELIKQETKKLLI